jgi:hypothetical protein
MGMKRRNFVEVIKVKIISLATANFFLFQLEGSDLQYSVLRNNTDIAVPVNKSAIYVNTVNILRFIAL